MLRRFVLFVSIVALIVAALLTFMFAEARRDPVVRRMTIAAAGWPVGVPPVTLALLSDIHLGSRAMDVGRLERIVDQVNALRPDLVLLDGDFVEGVDPVAGTAFAMQLTAPLSRLHARLGVVAVLGNHDHASAPGAVTRALRAAGVTVLTNWATRRGPLTVVGIDDAVTGHAMPAPAQDAARLLGGIPVTISHAPEVLPLLRKGSAPLLLLGHTHCGQIMVPGGSRLTRYINEGEPLYDPRYRCGVTHDPGRISVVTAGLGTSRVPMRFRAPPDMWLLTLRGR